MVAYYSLVVLLKFLLCLIHLIGFPFLYLHHIKSHELLLCKPLSFLKVHVADIESFWALRSCMPRLTTLKVHGSVQVPWFRGCKDARDNGDRPQWVQSVGNWGCIPQERWRVWEPHQKFLKQAVATQRCLVVQDDPWGCSKSFIGHTIFIA